MINVLARHARRHVATINYAFEKPAKDDLIAEQTFLDPLNQQSPWPAALLDLFVNVVLADADYQQRLMRRYRMFKKAVDDRAHPPYPLGYLPEVDAASARRSALRPQTERHRSSGGVAGADGNRASKEDL